MTLMVLAKPPGFKPQAQVAKALLYNSEITAIIIFSTAHFTCLTQTPCVAHVQMIKTPQPWTKRALQPHEGQEIDLI